MKEVWGGGLRDVSEESSGSTAERRIPGPMWRWGKSDAWCGGARGFQFECVCVCV